MWFVIWGSEKEWKGEKERGKVGEMKERRGEVEEKREKGAERTNEEKVGKRRWKMKGGRIREK